MPNIFKHSKRFVEDYFGLSIGLAKSRKVIINEAIDLDKKIIFIAITKTGTTSIRSQLQQVGEPWLKPSHLSIIQIRDLIYPYLLKQNLANNHSFPNNNRVSDQQLREQAKGIFNDCFKFSTVRNPWARAVSLYYRSEGMQLSNRMTFQEFCKQHSFASDTCQNPTLHRNQYDWHCDEKGNNLMDYVFKIEEFDQAISTLYERTNGKINLKPIQRNNNPKSPSKQYQAMYNEQTKKLIANRFEKDIDLFKYTF